MSYLKGHKKSGLKVGDIVTVIKKAETNEQGWADVWINDMDNYVGKSGYISDDKKYKGFYVIFTNNSFVFPYFV